MNNVTKTIIYHMTHLRCRLAARSRCSVVVKWTIQTPQNYSLRPAVRNSILRIKFYKGSEWPLLWHCEVSLLQLLSDYHYYLIALYFQYTSWNRTILWLFVLKDLKRHVYFRTKPHWEAFLQKPPSLDGSFNINLGNERRDIFSLKISIINS